MFICLYLPPLTGRPAATQDTLPWDLERAGRGDLASLAREFSPRVEVHAPGLVTLDAHGLERLFGDVNSLGQELRRGAADRGLPVRIAIAPTRTTAWLVAHARAGLTIVGDGQQARWLAPLPLNVLEQLAANGLGPAAPHGIDQPTASHGVADAAASAHTIGSHNERPGTAPGASRSYRVRPTFHVPDTPSRPSRARRVPHPQQEQAVALLAVLKRWGLRTLGDFAALPPLALSERLGQQGLAWQRVARGDEMAPLVPDAPDERFEETLDLEWPIEGLQPLSFVLGRLFDALSARLFERDRAAAVLHIHLQLVNRQVERRVLQLPAPMREARVLRTLALLNLEAHPVSAGIDRVTIVADPVPGRVIQCSLLTRALPFPEQMSTLVARLAAVMGEGRCGMAALVDSYRPGAFEMKAFTLAEWQKGNRKSQVARRHVRTSGPSDPGTRNQAPGTRTRDQGPGTRDSHQGPGTRDQGPICVLRRFRVPVPASVALKDGRPAHVAANRDGLRGGVVQTCVGPWRTSGEWWRVSEARVQSDGESRLPLAVGWNRDEWDVNLPDGVYRIYRDRDRDRWFVDGVID